MQNVPGQLPLWSECRTCQFTVFPQAVGYVTLVIRTHESGKGWTTDPYQVLTIAEALDVIDVTVAGMMP